MTDGVAVTRPVQHGSVPRRAVRLKVPRRKAVQAPAAASAGPPLYTPCPDTLLGLTRCLWCLTQVDPNVPVKFRKCPRCGKQGETAFPLYSRIMFVEYF